MIVFSSSLYTFCDGVGEVDDIVDDEVAKLILRLCAMVLIITTFSLQFFILRYKCNMKKH